MITQKRLHDLFEYRDGALVWKQYRNGIRKDRIGGSINPTTGHYQIMIDKKLYNLHRMIFLYHHGYLTPGMDIDHIDGNPGNNRIDNLREVTKSQNLMNSKLRPTNTSGIKGVSWHKHVKKWHARIQAEGKNIHLGYYELLEEAKAVVKEAREKYHGEYARHE